MKIMMGEVASLCTLIVASFPGPSHVRNVATLRTWDGPGNEATLIVEHM